MGSDSDLKVMKTAAETLEEFGIGYSMKILSAHRTPEQAAVFAEKAHTEFECVICGAGLAAHLAGAIAARTHLPVIGVPLASGALHGRDALYATVQMPPGIPVATVGIDNAKNAALLAVQILARKHPEIEQKLLDYRKKQSHKTLEKAEKLREKGWKQFLEEQSEKK
jgi:5-(carboxyamino)imidazole ribonucleotide mutase